MQSLNDCHNTVIASKEKAALRFLDSLVAKGPHSWKNTYHYTDLWAFFNRLSVKMNRYFKFCLPVRTSKYSWGPCILQPPLPPPFPIWNSVIWKENAPKQMKQVLPLQLADYEVLFYSQPAACGQHCPLPTPGHLYSQSSSSSRTGVTSGHQHPTRSA